MKWFGNFFPPHQPSVSDSSVNSVSTDHWSDAGTGTTFALNLSRGANEVSVPAAPTETLITV